ncbi:quinoprotein dehydrogenase-associated SoxYZ-like carrier [Paracoccus zhejiangensis]|uniref:Quinoprotein dehydrogenase-associated SoxYZ-like carrier n=1 Tax=Paracoccus zhejiangensis TaxID=1077935 RepID=A0A2H5F0J0_9RHOB|nr:quinoprotein dehydrogenase-associated SoxYZ-like carrier [Paracoccus zhejiangensis]AUH65068.1 quinoprotein dehydrogenase-associated SoxYZ-like carrier [Paracoccus zhejiangensis]
MRPFLTLAFLALATPALAEDNPLQPSATWDDLRESVVGLTAEPPVDPAVFDLTAPIRANDAALVPIHITQPAGGAAITDLTVVIDENPAPVAAEYSFGPALMPLDFEVRMRVNAYSDVRGIATTEGGDTVMAGRFVKASGGCSAPAGKDMAAVAETMGQMRWKSVAEEGRTIGTLMIRHPNFSGLQRDQVTLLNIPAHFIDKLEVRQGEELLFTMSAGISVSEDPVFRFGYEPNGQPISVHVEDTEGQVWDQVFDAAG